MSQNNYKSALESAKKELDSLLRQNKEIEQRIVRLQQTVVALEALQEDSVAEKITVEVPVGNGVATYTTSLTDSIREVFRSNSSSILTPTQVRDALLERGVNLSKYAQPMVPIHNTLKRLASQAELGFIRSGDGKNDGYRWIDPFVRALAKVSIPPASSFASGFIRAFGEVPSQHTKPARRKKDRGE